MSEQTVKTAHSLILDNRSTLSLSGVEDVPGFDEQTVNLSTACGTLIVKGENLHINKLNLDSKDVCIDGTINSLQYLNTNQKSIKSKLFK
ncbi:MAG: sporulation protein YabP [Ruminococcus sp.]|nr:sporulation protein YabP [Ruminococcus sp.]MBQ7133374.1 sporulation protein YabP [Ruminococcus sp.]